MKEPARLDPTDLRILAAMQRRGDLTHAELADIVHLSPSQCSRRLQRLRDEGYVARIAAILSPERLGLGLKCYVTVEITGHGEERTRAFTRAVQASDNVLECHMLTGEADYLLKVVAADLAAFQRFIQMLLALPEVARVRSSIVLAEIKETTALPLPTPSA